MLKKPYQIGLVVGKFSPLHKGHEYLIETANSYCEKLIIISYSRPEFPSCSANIRNKWLNSLYPKNTILCLDAPTVEAWKSEHNWTLSMPLNSDADEPHRKFTHTLLSEKLNFDIDAVFTSESYGDGFAEYLSENQKSGKKVKHICVDIKRAHIPISGTQIRSSPYLPEDKLSKLVLRDFQVKKVCFLGGESTGKSTLSLLLSKEFKEPLVDEYGRLLWEQNKGILTPIDLINICITQTRNEDIAQQKSKNFIFCDTSPLTTLSYSEAMFNERPKIIEAFAERPYHHVFLCDPDFSFQQDGTRKNEDFRKWQHEWYIKELRERQIPFTHLNGEIGHRIDQIKSDMLDALR